MTHNSAPLPRQRTSTTAIIVFAAAFTMLFTLLFTMP